MRLRLFIVSLCAALLGTVAFAAPASAATLDEKLAVLSSFTQPTTSSYNAWDAARNNQAAWADYGFNWSTDYCSSSPDQPLGFDFRMPCWHHDFGYRNYHALNQFAANKDRVDSMFYFDLRAKCATYSVWVRSVCYGLAWTYYQAVHLFGSVIIAPATLDRFAQMKAAAQTRSAA